MAGMFAGLGLGGVMLVSPAVADDTPVPKPPSNPFIQMVGALTPTDWPGYIRDDLGVSLEAYVHQAKIAGIEAYPRSDLVRVPVRILGKRGIRDALNPNSQPVRRTINWEICADGELPRVYPVTASGDGRDKGPAFTYVAVGDMRADAVAGRNVAPKTVLFSFLMVGTAIRKHETGQPPVDAQDSAPQWIDLGPQSPVRYAMSFTKNRVAYALVIFNLDCNDGCGDLGSEFLDDIRRSIYVVGGLPADLGVANVSTGPGTPISQNEDSDPDPDPDPEPEPEPEPAFRYAAPGELYESGRTGVAAVRAYTPGLASPFPTSEDDGRPVGGYTVADHRELAAIIADDGDVDSFFGGAWQDTFCASGAAADRRCPSNMGYVWQDVFPDTCRPDPRYTPHAGPGFTVDLSQFKAAVLPDGDIVLARPGSVVRPGSDGDCGFVSVLSMIHHDAAPRYVIEPPYVSFVSHRLNTRLPQREQPPS
ncbi:MAG: hypothetical protein WAU86_19980 [Oricola sp.]